MKWIKISEVKKEKLVEYLMKIKQGWVLMSGLLFLIGIFGRQTIPLKENYTLIGLEQTSNSVEIQDFDFPKKSVLVLGNEREGIPIDLISYFDAVCEIPQRKQVCNSMSHIFYDS